jgi:hypothetical protein
VTALTNVDLIGLPMFVPKQPKARRLERICEDCRQRPAVMLCDWKTDKGAATCDRMVCAECGSQPAPSKDLCRKHTEEWHARIERLKRPGGMTFPPDHQLSRARSASPVSDQPPEETLP